MWQEYVIMAVNFTLYFSMIGLMIGVVISICQKALIKIRSLRGSEHSKIKRRYFL